MKYAAIDIGSNAIRLLVANVVETKEGLKHKKTSLVRVPIRLGADVFANNNISEKQEKRLISAMKAYRHLMKVHEVEKYRACATSAFREADNGKEIIEKVLDKSGLKIDLISGEEEARIIYSTHIEKLLENNDNILYVDVGGGSTEISLFCDKMLIASKSFKIGTVRLLQGNEAPGSWDEMQNWLKVSLNNQKVDYIVGSGGNINKLIKINNEFTGSISKVISTDQLQVIYENILKYSYEDRVSELGLNPDRADVIIPAAQIFLSVLNWGEIKEIYVPKIGLVDGLVMELYSNPDFKYHTI